MIGLFRKRQLGYLGAFSFDVLIVGGGIVGAGIARDAAMRGLKVALIEQGDFASGTSSKTSKLIHGGLRYLEHGHVRLVFESLRERQILRTTAPSHVRPLSLLLPVYQGDRRSAWKINLGLWLYDLLSCGRRIRPHRLLSARRALALEPSLRVDGLRAAGLYADCQMDDARLCLLNILQAVQFGAICCNYVRLQELLKSDDRICGGRVEDRLSGRAHEIRAKVVVNATGPWADGMRRLSQVHAAKRLAPTKGIHLILPRLAQEALFVQGKRDERLLFLLPFGDYSLVGTTETPLRGPLEDLSASAEEVGYLLEEVNRVLPGAHVDEKAVVATYAGARPLLAFSGSSARASREHRIEIDRWGLVSVMGGKFTTYRRMAQEAVDELLERARRKQERCLTDQVSLLEAIHPVSFDHWQDVVRTMDPDLLARLIARYGASLLAILQRLSQEPSLARAFCPHHEYLEAEIVHAIEQEMACTMTDILARRTRIAWSSCQGLDGLSTLQRLLQQYGGLGEDTLEQQANEYRRFLAEGLAFRDGWGSIAPAKVASALPHG